MNIPASILVFLHREADNEYSSFDSLNAAADRIIEYSEEGNNMHRLMVYIDHELPQKEKDKFWKRVQSAGVTDVYRITPAVLLNAL